MDMTVGEVAKRSDVAVSALHFYEKKGLISSWRNSGNQRRYSRNVLRRIAVIKAAQKVGLSLEEISQALSILPKHQAPNRGDWEKLATHWDTLVSERILRLKKLQSNLGYCIGCGCLSMESCRLYNPDDEYNNEHPSSNRLEIMDTP
ncbi:redox-sensitive transcriptional activator SoxR [Vibrio sp.]|nr:redox-sensitive transcriptional activator SoxR [Vibrio sp.]